MKIFTLIFISLTLAYISRCYGSDRSYVEFLPDQALVKKINSWNLTLPPPSKLIKFPDGDISEPIHDLQLIGSDPYEYFSIINNHKLIEQIIFHRRVNTSSFLAAVRRLNDVKGLNYIGNLLEIKFLNNQKIFQLTNPATLNQFLRNNFATIYVAYISNELIEPKVAIKSFKKMKYFLENGGE